MTFYSLNRLKSLITPLGYCLSTLVHITDHIDDFPFTFTCVIEQSCNEGAVLEEGVCGGDVLKVALLKHRVLKHHGLHLQVEESGEQVTGFVSYILQNVLFCGINLVLYSLSNVNLTI